jgi:hypothetical protein
MGYNPTPAWARVRLQPQFIDMLCPCCGESVWNAIRKAFHDALTAGYYHPRHIPPEFVFNCPNCEKDLEIPLEVEIQTHALPRRVQ